MTDHAKVELRHIAAAIKLANHYAASSVAIAAHTTLAQALADAEMAGREAERDEIHDLIGNYEMVDVNEDGHDLLSDYCGKVQDAIRSRPRRST